MVTEHYLKRKTGRTPLPSWPQSSLLWTESAPVKVTADLLPGPATDVASPTLSFTAVQPLVHSVANAASPKTGHTCESHMNTDSSPEEQKMVTLRPDGNPDTNAEEIGNNIKVS